MDKENTLRDYTIYSITYCLNLVRLCYVGSTNNIERRIKQHTSNCFNIKLPIYNTKLYKAMRQYGVENFKFKIAFELKSATKHQVLIVEELFRIYLKANLNHIRCFRAEEHKKYYQKENNKKYRENNVEQIKESVKKYYENNRDEILEKQKKYYEENIEQIKEYREKYREDNKERLYEKNNCVCGGKFTFSNKSQHENTNLHKNFILKNLLYE